MKMTYSWIIYSYSWLVFGSGIVCERKLERRQAASSCFKNTDDMFNCSNELCIEWSWVCDGYKDCSDGSDETKDMCDRYEYGTNMTMDCGRIRIKNQVISKKDNEESKVTAPWHVQIFRLHEGLYFYVCGGTIIAPNLVISVAHFFLKSNMISTNTSMNYDLYTICVGFCDRRLPKIINNDFTQTMNVEMIYLGEGYDGTYNQDIAVIVLANKVSFINGLAAPVCIDWNKKYNLVNGDQGKVFFSKSPLEDDYVLIFLEKNSSYINYKTCRRMHLSNDSSFPVFLKYMNFDKFCATVDLGQFKGFSPIHSLFNNDESKFHKTVRRIYGTGIMFLHSSSYFLTGVDILSDDLTNSTMIVGYTDIKYHVDWIRGILNKHLTVKSCVLPTVEGVVYSYVDSNETLPHGTLIDHNLHVIENCEVGYHRAYPSPLRYCQEKGKWLSNSEKLCFKMCPPLESDSLDIKCSYNGKYSNCSNLSIPDTIATPSCKPTFSAPNCQEDTPLELHCQSNGIWNKPLYTCKPDCGRVYYNKSMVLINNGEKAIVGTAPWNVGLYRFNINNFDYNLKCGGSIISPNLVVSAAHCFAKDILSSKNISITDGRYKIAVGKYDRNFTIIDNEFTKIINVVTVYVKEGYNGNLWFFTDDIAIAVLQNRVYFNNGVAPVCIDWNGKYNVANGDQGKIFGWGATENASSSPNLLEASLPYIDYSSCRKSYTNGFEHYVTVDKFCAGSELGQGVLHGDSGAGLCFLHSGSYYLTGVVSVKDPYTNNSISVFSEVKYHIQWIRSLYNKYNLKL